MERPSLSEPPIVIEQPWGGLGDNLQFSTLPEMFAAQGRAVFVSARNSVRNEEIHELVWGRNPYVSGLSTAPATAGACRAAVYDGQLPRYTDFIRRVEIAHGLPATHDFPRVYYAPSQRHDLEDDVLVDVGSISRGFSIEQITGYLRFVFQQFAYPLARAYQVEFQRQVATQNLLRLRELPPLPVRSIFEYCDALHSCRALITVHSGAQSLAVALRQERAGPVIHCLASPQQFNWRNYIFPRVEYHVA
jgi:hypothetical protein